MMDIIDDMLFSGDIEGFIRRRSKDILQEEFLSFLQKRVAECDDEDEKNAILAASGIINEKLRLSDGLGDQTGEVFERRLDQILFKSPNQRMAFIEENTDDMTPGFVDYIKQELKNTADTDSKVVLASVLQMIGKVKGFDVLGSDASLLVSERSLTTLGDASGSPLLSSSMNDPNEQILASLMFSKFDVLEDVLNNIQFLDEQFMTFLQQKIDYSSDMEERVALRSLLDVITSVQDRIREANEQGIDVTDQELEIEDVRRRMVEVQGGAATTETAKVYREFQLQADKKDTFMTVLKRFQDLPEGVTLDMAVEANYNLCDKEFMEALEVEIKDCLEQGADMEVQEYQALLDTITRQMANRMAAAQTKLETILSKGAGRGPAGLAAMETEIVAMSRRKELDEALMLLMEANMQQAQTAGAAQVVEVFGKLISRMRSEQERNLPDEQRLLRQLLRLASSEERKGLLYAAFKPSKTVNEDGDFVDGPPIIPPPRFIALLRSFVASFGNVDGFDIMGRAAVVVEEAELVATDLYGVGLSPRQQQEKMFKEKTLSVWDLANFEEQALMSGEDVPWGNDQFNDMGPEEVLGERVRRVGGANGLGV